MRVTSTGCLVLSTLAAASSYIKLDLHKSSNGNAQIAKRANPAELPLTQAPSKAYYALNLSIGTPPQPFFLDIDTGSSDTWVLSDTALDAMVYQRLMPSGNYTSNASSTFRMVEQGGLVEQYGLGPGGAWGLGDYISDTVTIGNTKLSNVTFGLARNASGMTGLMGLGFGVPSTEYPTILEEMKAQGILSRQAFSIWLNDLEAQKGSILFGALDTEKYIGPLTAVRMAASPGDYQRTMIHLTSIQLSTTSKITTSNFPQLAVLDTGTTHSYLTAEIINPLIHALEAQPILEKSDSMCTSYRCACSKADTDGPLYFQFGGEQGPKIKVMLSDFMQPESRLPNGTDMCELLMHSCDLDGSSNLPSLLGDSFLRSAYVVYDLDNKVIALAQSKFNSTVENIVVIPSGTALPGVSSTVGPSSPASTAAERRSKATPPWPQPPTVIPPSIPPQSPQSQVVLAWPKSSIEDDKASAVKGGIPLVDGLLGIRCNDR